MQANLISHIGILSILPSLGKAQESVVNKAIEVSGMEKMKNAEASFTFRKHTYSYQRQNGQFTYTRIGKNEDAVW